VEEEVEKEEAEEEEEQGEMKQWVLKLRWTTWHDPTSIVPLHTRR